MEPQDRERLKDFLRELGGLLRQASKWGWLTESEGQLLDRAWEQRIVEMETLIDDPTNAEAFDLAGMSGPALEVKVAVFRRIAQSHYEPPLKGGFWRRLRKSFRVTKAPAMKFFKAALSQANVILKSLAEAVPGGSFLTELKDTVDVATQVAD